MTRVDRVADPEGFLCLEMPKEPGQPGRLVRKIREYLPCVLGFQVGTC